MSERVQRVTAPVRVTCVMGTTTSSEAGASAQPVARKTVSLQANAEVRELEASDSHSL